MGKVIWVMVEDLDMVGIVGIDVCRVSVIVLVIVVGFIGIVSVVLGMWVMFDVYVGGV